jgi:hypothetical protein
MHRTLVDFAPLIYANGEGTFVRACMVSPCAAFVVVVPFVQVLIDLSIFSIGRGCCSRSLRKLCS